eukprot:PhM_4_TR2395/c0_g1_i3/m.104358
MGCASSNVVRPAGGTTSAGNNNHNNKGPYSLHTTLPEQHRYLIPEPHHGLYRNDGLFESPRSDGVEVSEGAAAGTHRRKILLTKIVDKWKDIKFGEAELEEPLPLHPIVLARIKAWLVGAVELAAYAVVDGVPEYTDSDYDYVSPDVHTEIGSVSSSLELSRSQLDGLNPQKPFRLSTPSYLHEHLEMLFLKERAENLNCSGQSTPTSKRDSPATDSESLPRPIPVLVERRKISQSRMRHNNKPTLSAAPQAPQTLSARATSMPRLEILSDGDENDDDEDVVSGQEQQEHRHQHLVVESLTPQNRNNQHTNNNSNTATTINTSNSNIGNSQAEGTHEDQQKQQQTEKNV